MERITQSFFSVHANIRTDEYGGSPGGRSRFLTETLKQVRDEWPENLPLTARFGVLEFDGRDDETWPESMELVNQFRAGGMDLLSVSIGFSTPEATIPWGEGFMAPIAQRVRHETGLPVATAWGLDAPQRATQSIVLNQVDIVMVGRAHLKKPHWTYQAVLELDKNDPSWVLPPPYAHWLERYRVRD